MIHLSKSKTGFYVVTTGNNGELLHNTETLETKANCYKNIRSSMNQYGTPVLIRYQDDTVTPAAVYEISYKGRRKLLDKPKPKYTPKKK